MLLKQTTYEFTQRMEVELERILSYWQTRAIDNDNGGFVGRLNHQNLVVPKSNKGVVLNARLLWTFSAACNFYGDRRYDRECQRAYDYLEEKFRDHTFGGVFWEVDFQGQPVDRHKQIYAQAFCIYALAEYYKYCKNPKALVWAYDLFNLIENKAYDKIQGGYLEAFDERWGTIEDMRLSEKEINAPKTTNTMLHILEGYTTLYEVGKGSRVGASLERLMELFLNRIFQFNQHMRLFFSRDWKSMSSEISYGHDIEAAWLILHTAQVLENKVLIEKSEKLLAEVSKTFINEALDSDFGVINSKDSDTKEVDSDKHWWPQVEAMVGLIHNWKISKDPSYLNIAKQIWEFVDTKIIDRQYGGWYFRVNAEGEPYTLENKIGPWKCPYHNARALMVISKLLHKSG